VCVCLLPIDHVVDVTRVRIRCVYYVDLVDANQSVRRAVYEE